MRTVTGFLRRLPCRGAAQLVAAAFDKIIEGVMALQIAGEGLGWRRRNVRGAERLREPISKETSLCPAK
jgi:hypothetical protein